MYTVEHLKTGHIYYVVNDNVINATNHDDGVIMVLYVNTDNMCFVRERNEFWQKFRRQDDSEGKA